MNAQIIEVKLEEVEQTEAGKKVPEAMTVIEMVLLVTPNPRRVQHATGDTGNEETQPQEKLRVVRYRVRPPATALHAQHDLLQQCKDDEPENQELIREVERTQDWNKDCGTHNQRPKQPALSLPPNLA